MTLKLGYSSLGALMYLHIDIDTEEFWFNLADACPVSPTVVSSLADYLSRVAL